MKNARQVAYDALYKTEKENSYSNLIIDAVLRDSDLDSRDRSFVSNLFYGVIERKLTIDYQLSLCLTKPIKKLKKDVLTILKMGTYQILFMDKVPDSAAVNESVKLSKNNNCQYAGSLINAILRKISKNGLVLPKEDSADYFSVKYSCPQWLIEKWNNEYGEEKTKQILDSSVKAPPIYIRVNTIKTTESELIEKLKAEDVEAKSTDIENALKIMNMGRGVETLDSFKKGLFHVQDLSSQLCAKALNAENGNLVFDLCSAPGGKAYTISEYMENSGKIKAFDIYPSRIDLIESGAKRLGIDIIEGCISDAGIFRKTLGKADRVLCDVPCSGLGIIRRKPEIKYKSEESIKDLPELQLKILSNGSNYVKDGGRLIYSTCALNKEENDAVCDKFLKENSDFISVNPFDKESKEKYNTFIPAIDGGDGFFIACFEKRGN